MGIIFTTMEAVKKRDSNIELFRIIAMLLIVAHHYVVNSGITQIIAEPPYTWHTYFLYLFGMWGKIGINCFVLITGYFMCTADISLRKFLRLLLEIWFYNIVIYAAFVISGYEPVSFSGIYAALLPLASVEKNFATCFLIYYLLIPYLNILIQHCTQKQHMTLLAICLLFFVVLDHLPQYYYLFNYVEWFCILHIIASYIRFYGPKQISSKHVGGLILGGIVLAMGSVVFQLVLKALGSPLGIGGPYFWVEDSNALIAVISSLMLFMGFKHIKISYHKWINVIASSMFGVLLIHANSDAMRRWLWVDTCHNTDWIYSAYLPLHAVGCTLAVFLACILIDRIRMFLVKLIQKAKAA